jgi:hypothetical protein
MPDVNGKMDEYDVYYDDSGLTIPEYYDPKRLLAMPLREITADRWDEKLNCLPPMQWHTGDGVNRFLISEAMTGDIYTQYARVHIHGKMRYFEKHVRYGQAGNETYITFQKCIQHVMAGVNG